jgi:hypothetical protein
LAAGITIWTAGAVAANEPPATPPAATSRFDSSASSSQEELVRQLLKALRAKDESALRRLRVSESEYREIILPGHVEPGKPLKRLTKEWADYAWESLDVKSHYYERFLLASFGGRTLELEKINYGEGEKELTYATYIAYPQARVALVDDAGKKVELETGSIAEVGGKYKFISFVRD